MKTRFLVHQNVYIILNEKLMAVDHHHQFIQINLFQPGAKVTIGQTEICTPCLMIASNVEHAIQTDFPVITLLVDNFSMLGKQLTHLIQCQHSDKRGYVSLKHIKSHQLWQCFNAKKGDIAQALYELFNSIMCHHEHLTSTLDSRIDNVLTYLNNLDNPEKSLNQFATMVNLSQSRLSHLFAQQVGMPFRSYQRYLRFKRLMPLLAHGYDLTQAAHEVGFSDAAHLSRECKKLFGIQPKQLKGKLTFEQV